jgi:glycosyltransferase involved in cell wall biosynthesis
MSVYLDPQWLLLLLAAYGLFVLVLALRRRIQAGPGRRVRRPFVSLLVVTRNKERVVEGLVRGLCSLAARADYAEFEVIVVDDKSADQTPDILDRLAGAYANLRIVDMEDLRGRAESAVEVGLFVCSSPVVLLLNVEGHVQPRELLDAVQYLLNGKDADPKSRPATARVHRLEARRGFQGKEPTNQTPN